MNDLKNLEENYRKFTIDNYLKRYSSALKHIAKLEDKTDEFLEFMCKHELYPDALKLFDKKHKVYEEIMNLHGDYFLRKNRYEDAGIAFHKIRNYERALEAYVTGGCWKEAIGVSSMLKLRYVLKNKIQVSCFFKQRMV